MQQVAAQLRICNSPPPAAPVFMNQAQSIGCGNAPGLKVVKRLPSGVSNNYTSLIAPAGIFSSNVSQAAANASASSFLSGLIYSGYAQCGWWNKSQTVTCPDGEQETTDAFTYFSQISQDDANAQAAAAACPTTCAINLKTLVWTFTDSSSGGWAYASVGADPSLVDFSAFGSGTAAEFGEITMATNITNILDTDCYYSVELIGQSFIATQDACGDCACAAAILYLTTVIEGDQTVQIINAYWTGSGNSCSTSSEGPNHPHFLVPAGQTIGVSLVASGGGTDCGVASSATGWALGTIHIVPVP